MMAKFSSPSSPLPAYDELRRSFLKVTQSTTSPGVYAVCHFGALFQANFNCATVRPSLFPGAYGPEARALRSRRSVAGPRALNFS